MRLLAIRFSFVFVLFGAMGNFAVAQDCAEQVLKKDKDERSLEDQQQLLRAEKSTEEARDTAEQVMEQLREALAEAPSRAEAEQLEAIAEAIVTPAEGPSFGIAPAGTCK